MSSVPEAAKPESAIPPDPSRVESRRPSLRKRMMGASLWSAGSVGLGHVLRLGANLVVTRLLVPEMFGVMAIVLTVSIVLLNLSDVGLHQSVVRHERAKERVFLNTVWSVQVVRGFVLCAVTVLLGLLLYAANLMGFVPANSTYAAPVLPWVLAASGLGSIAHGFHSTSVHTAVRELDMRRYVSLELAQQITQIVVMIVLAWLTRSIWAIVAANLIGQTLHTVLSHRLWPEVKNRWAWDRTVLSELMHFGKWLFLSSAVGVWALNADRLLLAGVADAHYMGLYSVAFGLSSAAVLVMEKLFGNVLLPAFSEMARNDPQRLAEIYLKARRRVDPVMLLGSGLLFATGPLLIDILYDERYRDAGPILSILALSLLLARYQLAHQVYLALNQPQYHAMLNAVRVVSTFTLIPLGLALGGLFWGLVAIALRELPAVLLTLWLNARHGLNRWRLEIGMLAWWVLGFALGHGGNRLAQWVGFW
ncbi:MAG TPA: oligosaccharide flippase family protein [Methylibium sp.]|uniref:oligosaccharide flippase family protein n=1 Tax=Methylibium sp. TaxID=2067992 RepID=UPI002DBB0F0D|nr:oligosaccharide flippase family protein [Methylibium sp.]HEU4458187.1 oligosaccharide flippase family protein [Methylibium sp.]